MKVSCAVSVQYHACLAYRLSGRRPGLGRRHDALCRAHAPDQRHHDRRCRRSRASRGCSRASTMPEGWHSHKVRVAGGIMIVNHEKFGKAGRGEIGGGIAIYDVSQAERAEADHQMADRRRRRAPLRFRRPLRLYLADGRGLYRQHRDDPRSRGSREADRGRALVDSRPVAGGRRGLSVGGLGAAALPSSAAPRRPAVCQLLASRPFHPRYLGHVAAEAGCRTSIPARPSRIRPTPACACRKSCKGRDIMVVADEDVAKLWPSPPSFAWVYDITNERTPVPIATFQVPGLDMDGSAAAGDDRLPSAIGALSRHGHSLRLVRARPAARRFRRSVPAEGGRAIICRSPPRARTGRLPTT